MNDTQTIVRLNEPVKSRVSLRLDRNIVIDVAIILAVVLLLFGRTPTSYFLADDFGEVNYISRIFEGNLSMLLANFTGNYMQIPGMSVYRPFLLLSLMLDFFFWRGNAFGYYLTNVSIYFFDAVLLYFIVRLLSGQSTPARSRLTALSSALFFACSPLHCESVSWILGRVDTACAFFYLLSLYLMLKSLTKTSRRYTYFALAAYISGMLVKEMAIGIPVLALALGFLFKNEESSFLSLTRLRGAFRFCIPYVAITCLYFLWRYICLGTLVGGYVAGFGASQQANLMTRWLDPDTIGRIAFPLVAGHFYNEKNITLALTGLYGMAATILLVKLAARQVPVKLFAFILVWAFSTLLPIYKLWGIGHNLEGARFIFFFTIPLSALLAAALVQNENKEASQRTRLDSSLTLISSAVAVGLCAIFAYLAAKTDLIWVNAGKEVRAASLAARIILDSNLDNPAVFLGIPKESKGAHMILNGDTFKAAVSPPFAGQKPRRKFETFEPVMYAPEHEINSQRLKSLSDNKADFFVWSASRRQYDKVEFAGGKAGLPSGAQLQAGGMQGLVNTTGAGVSFERNDGSQGILLSQLNLNPLAADFAVIEIKTGDNAGKRIIGASWSGKPGNQERLNESLIRESLKESQKGQFQTVYLPLSRHWKWFEKPTIQSIFFNLPAGDSAVRSIKLLTSEQCCPQIHVTGAEQNENGTYTVEAGVEPLLQVNARSLKGSHKLTLEVSKANYFFDNFKECAGVDAVDKRVPVVGNLFDGKLKRRHFTGSGFFQVRALALDENGQPVGAPSCCLTFQVR